MTCYEDDMCYILRDNVQGMGRHILRRMALLNFVIVENSLVVPLCLQTWPTSITCLLHSITICFHGNLSHGGLAQHKYKLEDVKSETMASCNDHDDLGVYEAVTHIHHFIL